MNISCFKFLVSIVTYFWPNLMKCPKMGSIGQVCIKPHKDCIKDCIKPHKAYYNSKRNSKKWGRLVH